MKLAFKGGDQIAILYIDREQKKLWLQSSKTNYKLTPRPWKDLFDKGKETIQDMKTSKMDDNDFKKEVVRCMNVLGYQLIEK